MKSVLMIVFVLSIVLLSACGRNDDRNGGDTSPPSPIQTESDLPPAPVPADASETVAVPADASEPTQVTADESEPANEVLLSYLAEPIIVGYGGEWPLNGLLTIPREASPTNPVPAAVLVQGSGSADMNHTLVWEGEAVSRPFYDVATYLSSNGVAVLRNDKRGYAHAGALNALAVRDITAFGSHTVWEEAVEDALLAAELLLADPRIDSERIYVIGLSLGAVLAPRIQLAAQARGFEFAGFVLMAGTPRCLVEVTLMQLNDNLDAAWAEVEAYSEYIDTLTLTAVETELAESQAMIDLLTENAPMIWDAPPEEARGMFWFGMSFYYLQDLANFTFEEAVAGIDTRMLVMQGARDFQVRADICFVLMQEILGGRENVTFKLYDDLNHIFMYSTAANHLEHGREMVLSPGRVDTQVLRDIVSWIINNVS